MVTTKDTPLRVITAMVHSTSSKARDMIIISPSSIPLDMLGIPNPICRIRACNSLICSSRICCSIRAITKMSLNLSSVASHLPKNRAPNLPTGTSVDRVPNRVGGHSLQLLLRRPPTLGWPLLRAISRISRHITKICLSWDPIPHGNVQTPHRPAPGRRLHDRHHLLLLNSLCSNLPGTNRPGPRIPLHLLTSVVCRCSSSPCRCSSSPCRCSSSPCRCSSSQCRCSRCGQ